MGERQTPIPTVRARLTGLLADWGAELSVLLKELEEKRARLEELENQSAGRDGQIVALQKRIDGQDVLIEALKEDAAETSRLRSEVRSKDLEFERINSELASKKELIQALRGDAESVDRLRAEAKLKDHEIERLKAEVARAAQRAEQSAAELEARKTLIKNLRADQDRVVALEASLQEKREVIAQLEASINRHANTSAELNRDADAWKRKDQSFKGAGPADTPTHLPTLSDTDVRALEQLEKIVETQSDATVAIDMRRSLLEARRAASRGRGEK